MAFVKTNLGGVRAKIVKCADGAQMKLGEIVLRDCGEYVPYRTGKLFSSGVYNHADRTVSWNTSYAHDCYYAEREFGRKIHPRATAHWAEAAKNTCSDMWCDEISKFF